MKMIKLKVRYIPMFSLWFETKEENIELEKGSIFEFANKIGEKYGLKYVNLIIDKNKCELNRTVFLMINEKEKRNLNLNYQLKNNDSLILGQIVAGG